MSDGGRWAGPMFWHLDGCNMDDDFPFSLYCRTRQEWEDKQRQQEEFDRQFDEQQRCRQERLAGRPAGERTGRGESVWKRSFSDPGPNEGPWVTVFGIGCRLAELVVNLKTSPDGLAVVKSLGRHFGNLRSAV